MIKIQTYDIPSGEGFRVELTITADENGMVQMGNNAICHIDEIKKAFKEKGMSYCTSSKTFHISL